MKPLPLLVVFAIALVGCRTPDGDVSPDGSKAVYANEKGLFLTELEGKTTTLVPNDCEHPTWSPDGRYILYSDNKTHSRTKLYDLSSRTTTDLGNLIQYPWDWNGTSTEITAVKAGDQLLVVVYHLPSRRIVRTYHSGSAVMELVRDPNSRAFATYTGQWITLFHDGKMEMVETEGDVASVWFDLQGQLEWCQSSGSPDKIEDWHTSVNRLEDGRFVEVLSFATLTAALKRQDRLSLPVVEVAEPNSQRYVVVGFEDASAPGVAQRFLELNSKEDEASQKEIRKLEDRLYLRCVVAVLDREGRLVARRVEPVIHLKDGELPGDVALSRNGRRLALVYMNRVRFVTLDPGNIE